MTGARASQVVEPAAVPSVDWAGLAPMVVLVAGAVLLLVVAGLAGGRRLARGYAPATVVIGVVSIACCIPLWDRVRDADEGPFLTVGRALGIDGFSVFFMVIIAVSVVLAALLTDGYQRREGLEGAELYVLVLLSAAGGMVMASSYDLVVTFLGLEILSIAVYVLAAMHLRRVQSQEAGLKYFLLGAFASAFFLYGIALVYGATGSTNMGDILESSGFRTGVVVEPTAMLLAGIGLLLVGFGFKIAAVPFHAWTPDVYQGSPTPVVAYMAAGVKAAGFAGLIRVFIYAFGPWAQDWQPYIYGLAVASLVVGAVLAVVQTDVKRMLAYSSISHAGFVLLGLQAASQTGIAGALFYLAAYTFMVAGSFGIATVVGRRGDARHQLADYRGLARRNPLLAFTFTVLLLAQAGVPLTSGFFAKFYVLRAAVEEGSWPLALVAMVSAVVAAFLYLRVIVAMYMGAGPGEAPEGDTAEAASTPAEVADAGPPRLRVPALAGVALAVTLVFTVVVGFAPGRLADLSDDAVSEAEASP